MVNRRQVLTGFLTIPAVIFANRALPRELPHSLTFGPDHNARSLWGQATLNGLPYGEPFPMVADPSTQGRAILRNPGRISLPPAPCDGELRVEIWSAEYGRLGSSAIMLNGPVTKDCEVVIHSVVTR